MEWLNEPAFDALTDLTDGYQIDVVQQITDLAAHADNLGGQLQLGLPRFRPEQLTEILSTLVMESIYLAETAEPGHLGASLEVGNPSFLAVARLSLQTSNWEWLLKGKPDEVRLHTEGILAGLFCINGLLCCDPLTWRQGLNPPMRLAHRRTVSQILRPMFARADVCAIDKLEELFGGPA